MGRVTGKVALVSGATRGQGPPMIQGMPIPYVEPEDISEAVLFLASDAARYVTGQQLRVDAAGFLKIRPWSGP